MAAKYNIEQRGFWFDPTANEATAKVDRARRPMGKTLTLPVPKDPPQEQPTLVIAGQEQSADGIEIRTVYGNLITGIKGKNSTDWYTDENIRHMDFLLEENHLHTAVALLTQRLESQRQSIPFSTQTTSEWRNIRLETGMIVSATVGRLNQLFPGERKKPFAQRDLVYREKRDLLGRVESVLASLDNKNRIRLHHPTV